MSWTVTLPEPNLRMRWLGTGALAALLVVAVAAPGLTSHPTLAADTSATVEHTISVSGEGRIVVPPDVADMQLGVSVTKPTAAEARDAAAADMAKVVAALKAAGIADRDIQTANLSLQAVYDYNSKSAPRLTGYQLSNIVAVTVRNLDRLAEAVDGAVKAGATTVDGITFRIENRAAAERQARAAAVAEAKAKADALAEAAGVSIVGLSSISETSAPTPQPIAFAGPTADRAAAPTPVQPGTVEVTIDVSVVYRLQ